MVGDRPEVVLPLEEPKLVVTLAVREELSSEQEAKEFDWESYAGLMIAALIVPRNSDALVEYWRANVNMLDWAKKVKPDTYERIRQAFAGRKHELSGGRDG